MVVLGRNGDAVNRTAAAITSEMETLSELAQLISTEELDRPGLRVRPNQYLAAELGILKGGNR